MKPKAKKGRRILYATALLVALLLLDVPLILRYLGVSDQFRQRFQSELESRGVVVEIGKLYFDFTGGVVAREVRVFQTKDEKTTQVDVDRVRFALNWISWWRGQPFLKRATVQNATLRFPITQEVAVKLDSVRADVELKTGQLLVRDAEGKIGNLVLRLNGTIALEGTPPKKESLTRAELEARAKTWLKVQRHLETISKPTSVDVEFDVSSRDVLNGKIRLQAEAEGVWWREVLIHEAVLKVDYEENRVRLEEAKLVLARGELQARGVFQLDEKKGELNYRSDVDFTLLRNFFPENMREGIAGVKFPFSPVSEGIFECEWKDEFRFFLRASANWKNFIIWGNLYDQFRAEASYDGERLFVSDFLLKDRTGELTLQFLRRKNGELKGKVKSTLDFTRMRGLLGKGAQPLLRSLEFHSEAPQIECEILGTAEAIRAKGNLSIKDFSYTNGNGTTTRLAEVKSPFTFESKVLNLPKLHVTRVEGEEASGRITYRFGKRSVWIKNAQCRVDVQKFVPLFGGKLEKYIQPYRFRKPPEVKVNGVVDLETQKETDLKVQILAEGGMDYDFLGKTLAFDRVKGEVLTVGEKLTVKLEPGTKLFDGELTGKIDLTLNRPGPPYRAQVKLKGMAFQKILQTYFNKKDVTGTCAAELDLTGRLDDMKSLKGGGELRVRDGDVYQIPLLSALSEELSEVIPFLGYSQARDAESKFSFSDGVIHIDGLEIFSLTMAMTGEGTYDYIQDNVDLAVRVNLRGLMGLPFLPFSELFKYEGKGKLGKVKWEPAVF